VEVAPLIVAVAYEGMAAVFGAANQDGPSSVNLLAQGSVEVVGRAVVSLQQSDVEGRTQIDIVNEAGSEASTKTKVDATYVSSSKQTIKRFKPTMTLYRKLSNGNYEVKSLYVVSNE
jgi:hypothetical protein